MRHTLPALALLALLSGCASHSVTDPSGTWINQNAIDDAVKGGNLRQALLADGPNLEWKIDGKAKEATFSNGFELGEGSLGQSGAGQWNVDIYGSGQETLTIDGSHLTQAATDNGPEQHFVKADTKDQPDAPPGAVFEARLYQAFLGGQWSIADGQGTGATVVFHPDGRVEGLPGLDRYALCLAGDCAAMSGEYDSMWLERDKMGDAYIFRRDGKRLEILETVNTAGNDEMPNLQPGARRWLLQRQ
ncbi:MULTISPECIES: hypothetical protein [unclassified Pseudomonas]|uniref:hypothetical protein n=1 Tax=unclassified Pseudomonas TaxID=196821 RepID=UPI000BD32D02|nr:MULTISPECIES: hypothetical protein [unclassified Pseudomonas]PVZ15312.1 hypothetical protein F474_02087 [Pseudomonas sp. URIL14HWK12:I12]PVZ24686.1 hypothetical protein F470_01742 [Pseudomonas sp. URIL14HWK12:I10]PVZ34531.1 hypothetical protein F472_02087 [Pseudomonas sp. URIL14HWK12:I11]SNZ08569.1 hypothetical protein SAMN05660463_01075 [Pseudomonas sp. URIL14HWK12:I9]